MRAPDRLRSVNFAPSAESADTQSAAGSAWLRDPPTVPRLRTAAIGDIAGDAPHGAARDIRNTSVLDIGVGNTGAEHQFVAATLDLLELGESGNVDDHLRLDQPQIEHRAERLAPGDDLGGVVCLGHQSKCRRQIAWAFVAEGSGFMPPALSASRAARIASTTRKGVTGRLHQFGAKRPQRVVERVDDRRRRRDRATLADAFDTDCV